eukprot:9466964-Pyramimonas_sp.AAC.1
MSLARLEVLGHVLHPGGNPVIGTKILVWALMSVSPHPNKVLDHQCGPSRRYTHCSIKYQSEGRRTVM